MLYKIAKIFHLTGLILWLGPSTGGFLVLLSARLRGQETVALWLFKEYIRLIEIEAIGLLILVLSGLTMRSLAPALKRAAWLRYKLRIVFPVFIPLELSQLYIYHFIVDKAFLSGKGIAEAIALYDRFMVFSAVILILAVPAVFILAVLRPFDEG